MDYDVEREKQKSEEFRKAFRECFPLVPEHELPWAASHVKSFLGRRIEREVEEQTRYFTSRICKVLCEVSPPKTHIEDMCRIAVNQIKDAESKLETLERQLAASKKSITELTAYIESCRQMIGGEGLLAVLIERLIKERDSLVQAVTTPTATEEPSQSPSDVLPEERPNKTNRAKRL